MIAGSAGKYDNDRDRQCLENGDDIRHHSALSLLKLLFMRVQEKKEPLRV
jgi:hypothetical protein